VGCLCTNMSFAHGSASLVQVVKLLEPIETIMVMAFVNVFLRGKPHGVAASKAISVLVIVTGTSLLLAQKAMQPNITSVVFALLSGFAMASRNVAAKSGSSQAASISTDTLVVESTWMAASLEGIRNFLRITAIASVPASVLLLFVEWVGLYSSGISLIVLICRSGPGCQAVLFHAMYNMASITVLSLVSAPTHSILKVGKRIATLLLQRLPLVYRWNREE
jgi:hypothetical protein